MNTRAYEPMSPDPYGEFFSPYLAMGNNPVSTIDPDGGRVMRSGSGAAFEADNPGRERKVDPFDMVGGGGTREEFYHIDENGKMVQDPGRLEQIYELGTNGSSGGEQKSSSVDGYRFEYTTNEGETITISSYFSGQTFVNGIMLDNSDAGNSGSGIDFSNSKLALDIGGGIYSGLQGMTASQGQWLGKNGKYYSDSWGGNRYTGSRSGALKVANNYKVAGYTVLGVSVVIGGIETYQGYQKDGDQFGYYAQSAAAQTIGSIGGGLAGAEVGIYVGGAGALFGGFGAVPGAAIGGFVGGLIGGNLGSGAGQGTVNFCHGR